MTDKHENQSYKHNIASFLCIDDNTRHLIILVLIVPYNGKLFNESIPCFVLFSMMQHLLSTKCKLVLEFRGNSGTISYDCDNKNQTNLKQDFTLQHVKVSSMRVLI